MKIKELDVFHFRYKPKIAETMSYPDHCFDGQLIAKKNQKGEIYLEDTYWSSGDKCFTPKEAKEKGILTFYCNLNEVEEIGEGSQDYYADEDIFNLSHQHGCYRKFAVRKDAQRNKEKMLSVINERIREAKRKIEWLLEDLERYSVTRHEIEKDNLDVWL